jgi:hypothetical protein
MPSSERLASLLAARFLEHLFSGDTQPANAKRLKDLEAENTRLRRAVSEVTLGKVILQEAARGNY